MTNPLNTEEPNTNKEFLCLCRFFDRFASTEKVEQGQKKNQEQKKKEKRDGE